VTDAQLEARVSTLAEELEVPGVAVGVFHGEQERYAFHGVTSVENPLAVDDRTLFQFGSTGKTFTAVAILRLVDEGRVELHAPVKRYVPELQLRDPGVAETVTVLQLLNHTAGWDGDDFEDTGDGDDAIARFVEHMAELQQISAPGFIVSYNNAALALAGRLIEKVTGSVYERAVRELVLEPIGLTNTFFFPNEVMTRRFVVGHRREPDGTQRVLRPWTMPRSGNPMGGMAASAPDQLRWARFHLDHGRTGDGRQVIAPELIDRMQEPTAEMPGSDLGDAVGISWLLSEVGGEKVVAHGGSTLGQYAGFVMVPSRRFAIVSLTNGEPNGPLFNRRMRDWALATYLDLHRTTPVAESRAADALAEYAGTYETVSSLISVALDGGRLCMEVEAKPSFLEQLGADAEDENEPPIALGMIPGGDRYVVPDGSHDGETGFFVRDEAGRIVGLHVHGRYAPRRP
jgi:CubicO group peptidase (beta-lactamase class C family)